MIKSIKLSFSGIALCMLMTAFCFIAGCNSASRSNDSDRPSMIAHYTSSPVNVDGVLDEPVWANAIMYPLSLSADNLKKGQTLQENGTARLAWDDTFFYVAVSFEDSDIIAEKDQDQAHHYQFGDLAELFLKPANSTWYWELYATPRGNKTAFFFPGRGRLGLPSCDAYTCGLQTAAQCQGTLNLWQDRDQSWTAEFAMPLKDLTAWGDSFAPGADWLVMVSRYNYSRYLSHTELSMTPSLSASNYHLNEDYAALLLLKP